MTYPTFLINLEQHTSRRRFMEAQFEALGLPLIRLNAALGRDPEVRATAAVAPYATLTDGEIGCFESHRRFWARVIEDDLPGAFVVEDDVVVASDFGDLVFPDAVLQQAHVIKIDQGVRNVCTYGSTRVDVTEDRALIRLLGTEFSTGCYFVTRAGAEHLLAKSKNYYLPVDRYMFDEMSKVFWQMQVWRMVLAAATQVRLLCPDVDEEGELADSISANRVSGREVTPVMDTVKKWRLRFRRLLDWDFRHVRNARLARELQRFAQSEPLVSDEIGFHSPNDAHYRTLLKASQV